MKNKKFTAFLYRTLHVDIVSVFLVLAMFSAGCIMFFTYSANDRAILEFSNGTIHRVSALIVEKMECLFKRISRLPSRSTVFFSRHPEISAENQALFYYLLETIKYHEHINTFYVGTPDGKFICAIRQSAVSAKYKARSASPDSPFAVFVINHSPNKDNSEWYFYDENLHPVATEKRTDSFDPRERPWYQGAAETRNVFWTGLYQFLLSDEFGFTIATPVYKENGELIGVIGVDCPLTLLSQYLKNQKVEGQGSAFVLNAEGKIILPLNDPNPEATKLVDAAYLEFKKTNENDFHFVFQGTEYLVSNEIFPMHPQKNWYILIIDPILDQFGEIFSVQKEILWISIGILAFFALLIVLFAKRISRPIEMLAGEVDKIQHLNLSSTVRVKSNILEITLLDFSVASLRAALHSFGKYVPKEIVKTLIEKGEEIHLGTEKKDLTVMITDIMGFTTIAEQTPLETVNTLLSNYFDLLSNIILKNEGTVDKYLGDGIMAFWGAPHEVPNHAKSACITALLCESSLHEFNQKQKEKGEPELPTRIGIDTGALLVGNIGTSERMSYTIVGDAIESATHFQEINKIYHSKIIIGKNVLKNLENEFVVRPLGDFYELLGLKEGIPAIVASDADKDLAEKFTHAYDILISGDKPLAKSLFEEIHAKYPNDVPTQLYLDH